MPQVFKVGAYLVYFWSDENDPLEPIHVHVAEGKPRKDGTKIWITKSGKTLLANNNAGIPQKDLRNIKSDRIQCGFCDSKVDAAF